MLDLSLVLETKTTRVSNAVAAGTTTIDCASVDMTGFEGVAFVACFNALTATQVTELKAQQSSDNGVNNAFADLANSIVGPLADADSNLCLLLDVFRPTDRYVRPVIVRGTANAAIDSVIAIQYGPSRQPTTQDPTTVAASLYLASPQEGTA
jgi:hypothetical protein